MIDPRRACDACLAIATRAGMRLARIFETHRNQGYATGSLDLERRSGAVIHHDSAMAFAYGESTREGDTFDVGDLRLRILEPPEHTMESISQVLTDRDSGDTPVGVFTGDALFVGDVGRTDLFPDCACEVLGT